MPWTLPKLVDIPNLQMLMDRLYAATAIPVGIIAIDGEILVATGWQEICTHFHRVNPVTAERCRQSDAYIQSRLPTESYVQYKCKNGLWDLGVPIIIAGDHVATLFLGQFFYDDDAIDEEFYRRQALEFGFDVERYLTALRRIPVFSREKVRQIMEFFLSFVSFLVETGLATLQRKQAELALRESEAKFAAAFQSAPVSMAISTPDEGRFVDVNEEFERMHGYSRDEVIGRTAADLNLWCSLGERQTIIADLLRGETIRDREVMTLNRGNEVLNGLYSASMVEVGGEQLVLALRSDITARKRAEAALAEHLLEQQTLLETAPLAIFKLINRRVVWANQAAEQMFGCSRAEMVGQETRGLYLNEVDYLQTGSAAHAALVRGESFVMEQRMSHRDGTPLLIRFVGRAIDPSDLDKGEVWILEDISRREEMERELRFSEARFSQAFHSGPLLMTISNIENGQYLDVNEQFCSISGFSRDEAIGRTSVELGWISASERQRLSGELLALGRVAGVELTLTAKSGETVCCEYYGEIMDTLQGKMLLSIALDITQRKRAEEELRDSEAKFAAAFRTSPDSININRLDDAIFVEVNDTFTTLLGYTAEEVIGRPSVDMGIWIDPSLRWRLADQLRQHGVVDNLEARLRRKDGTIFDALISSRLIILNHQLCTLNIARDITGQKRAAAELAAAKDAAESASRAKSAFLANMSHEIRTPMTGIMGMTELLENTELTAKQKRYLEALRISSENLLSLINDVLDLSKIEAGKIELEKSAFSLRGSLSDLVKTQISLAYDKGLTIDTEISGDVPEILVGDQLRLKQILLNLVNNAIKFTERGGCTIRVDVRSLRNSRAWLRFSVTDTGIGIRREHLKKIFEPFCQADSSTTRIFGGTGLGLSICTRLVELMDGTIDVESKEGFGSTFHVVLPFVIYDALAERQVRRECLQPVSWEGAPLRILLVEDNEMNQQLLRELLQNLGHALSMARDGHEALRQWEQHRFDIILMDIQMPDMDGVEATRRIREHEEGTGCHVPIIALTAHALREDQQNFIRQGFDGYVSKPIKFHVLNEEIRRCLGL